MVLFETVEASNLCFQITKTAAPLIAHPDRMVFETSFLVRVSPFLGCCMYVIVWSSKTIGSDQVRQS